MPRFGSPYVRLTCDFGAPGLKTNPIEGSATSMFGLLQPTVAALGGLKRELAPIWAKIDWYTRPWKRPKPPRMAVLPGPPVSAFQNPEDALGDHEKPKRGSKYVLPL